MRVLLDTNIILHRETKDPTREEIGKLFLWLDRLKYDKYVHQITIDELSKRQNPSARKAFLIKIQSYNLLQTKAPLKSEVQEIAKKYDSTENDKNDTLLINEVYSDRVDILITEDRNIHKKALELGIDTKVFSIDSFLEKVSAENPDLVDYKVPSVKKEYFGNINLKDPFFDSFKEDYADFDKWFNRKADEIAYVCFSEGKVIAFLYLKREGESEPTQIFTPHSQRRNDLKLAHSKFSLTD